MAKDSSTTIKGLNDYLIMKASASSAEDGIAEAVYDYAKVSKGDSVVFLPGSYFTFTVADLLYIAVPTQALVAAVTLP